MDKRYREDDYLTRRRMLGEKEIDEVKEIKTERRIGKKRGNGREHAYLISKLTV